MTEKLILAVDLGTSGMKVALVTITGEIVGWESQPVRLLISPDGGTEQVPDEWWQAFLDASERLLGRQPAAREAVCAVCCSTQGEGTIPVDRDGTPLSNCMLWMDMRGAPALQKQLRGRVNLAGADATKVMRFINLTGGMPSMTGKDPAGHMLFIRDHRPEIYSRAYKFLNVLDYLNLRLTGRFVATVDSILTSWVTDNRRVDYVHYHPELIEMLGLDRDKLPEIVACAEVIGTLLPSVAARLGLHADVRVVAGSIDNTASAIGAGTISDYHTHLYLGTSSWMAAHVPFKRTDVFSSLASVPCALPNRYLMTALQATAGGNLTFLRDNILYHKDELLQEAQVPDIFKVLDQIAERVPPGSNGVLYTPWIWGERAPVDDKSVRAGLYNLSLHNTREDILRAFLEGIAFNTCWLLEPVERFLGRRVEHIHIVGGGAQSRVWCQIFADVLGVEVRQAAGPVYANVRGAAWIGAVALGELSFNQVPELVKFEQVFNPRSEYRALYKDKFETFKKLYHQLKGVYQHLNG